MYTNKNSHGAIVRFIYILRNYTVHLKLIFECTKTMTLTRLSTVTEWRMKDVQQLECGISLQSMRGKRRG